MTASEQGTPRPLRILHSSEAGQGGVGSYLRFISEMTPEDADQIFVIPSKQSQFLLPGDPRVKLFSHDKRNVLGGFRQARAIRQHIRQFKPDVLFLHSSFSLLALALLRLQGLNLPVIYCAHGWATSRYEKNSVKARIVAAAEGFLVGLADITISISRQDLTLAKEKGFRGQHKLLENAVPAPVEGPAPAELSESEDVLNILFVGRLDRQKGFDILVPAFERASAERKDLRLHVIGEAVWSEHEKSETSDNIIFHGWMDMTELDGWYRWVDALVVPSRWEGFGLVVAEAMRNGTPVICSDRGALPDLVTENETGHIFALDGQALYERLVSLKKSDLKAMREACLRTYETRFSMDRFYESLLELYKETLRARDA